MGWNTDLRDLLAPHFDAIKQLMEGGPKQVNEKQIAFVKAINDQNPRRPLEVAWAELHALPETQRDAIVRGFSKSNRTEQLKKSEAAFKKLLNRTRDDAQIDYRAEMLAQGIEAPSGTVDEPLGSRADFLKERARNKYNGR